MIYRLIAVVSAIRSVIADARALRRSLHRRYGVISE